MKKLKLWLKKVFLFIKKNWLLFSVGATFLVLLIIRLLSGTKQSEFEKKVEEQKQKNKTAIQQAEQAQEEVKKDLEKIKKEQEEIKKSKAERDAKADTIFKRKK